MVGGLSFYQPELGPIISLLEGGRVIMLPHPSIRNHHNFHIPPWESTKSKDNTTRHFGLGFLQFLGEIDYGCQGHLCQTAPCHNGRRLCRFFMVFSLPIILNSCQIDHLSLQYFTETCYTPATTSAHIVPGTSQESRY